jgi:hypothetical protein
MLRSFHSVRVSSLNTIGASVFNSASFSSRGRHLMPPMAFRGLIRFPLFSTVIDTARGFASPPSAEIDFDQLNKVDGKTNQIADLADRKFIALFNAGKVNGGTSVDLGSTKKFGASGASDVRG